MLAASFVVLVVGAGVGIYMLTPVSGPARDTTLVGDATRGEYLIRLGGCVTCHTDPKNKQAELAGGAGLTFFPAPPLMHGTSTLTSFVAFNYGQRIVIHRKYAPEEVLRTIEKEKVSSISLVGDAMLRPLIDALAGPMKDTDCSSLFSVSSSGAIMSETVRRQFQALVPNAMLLNNFGSSESGFNGTATQDAGAGDGFRIRVHSRTRVVDPASIAVDHHATLAYAIRANCSNDGGASPRAVSQRTQASYCARLGEHRDRRRLASDSASSGEWPASTSAHNPSSTERPMPNWQ